MRGLSLEREGPAAAGTLNRPEARNATTVEMDDALDALIPSRDLAPGPAAGTLSRGEVSPSSGGRRPRRGSRPR